MSEESSPESLKKQCHSIVDTVAPWILIVPPHADVEIDGVEQEVALPQMPATAEQLDELAADMRAASVLRS